MIFDRFTKKIVAKKIETTVDDNWDTILSVFGIIVGLGMVFVGRKEDRKPDISSIQITTNYNYYDQRRLGK